MDGDNIKEELLRTRDSGKTLWCEGRRHATPQCENKLSVICLDGDDEHKPTPKKVKV